MNLFLQALLLSLGISAASFGGIQSYWALVEKKSVVDCTPEKPAAPLAVCRPVFAQIFAISELLPGPQINAVALAFAPAAGLGGMLGIIGGAILPGLVLSPLMFWLLHLARARSMLKEFLAGTGTAAIALLIVFLARLLPAGNLRQLVFFIPIALAAFALRRYRRWSALFIIPLSGLAGYLVY